VYLSSSPTSWKGCIISRRTLFRAIVTRVHESRDRELRAWNGSYGSVSGRFVDSQRFLLRVDESLVWKIDYFTGCVITKGEKQGRNIVTLMNKKWTKRGINEQISSSSAIVNWINSTNRVLWLRYTRSTRSKRKKPATSRRKGNRRGGGGETALEKRRGGRREGGREGGEESGGCSRKMELLNDQWPADFSRWYSRFSAPLSPPSPPPLILFFPFLSVSFLNTYFSLAWESEGTDDPFPFAYIVAILAAGHFFQRKHKCTVVAPLHGTNEKERKIAGTSRVRVVRPYMYARIYGQQRLSHSIVRSQRYSLQQYATVAEDTSCVSNKMRHIYQSEKDVYIRRRTRSLSVSFPVSLCLSFSLVSKGITVGSVSFSLTLTLLNVHTNKMHGIFDPTFSRVTSRTRRCHSAGVKWPAAARY